MLNLIQNVYTYKKFIIKIKYYLNLIKNFLIFDGHTRFL